MNAITLAALAATATEAFITQEHIDGTKFITVADLSPEWIKSFVHAAHAGSFPNDSIYQMCYVASEIVLEWCVENPDAPDFNDAEMDVDSQVPIINHDLKQWLLNNSGADEVIEEIMDEGLYDQSEGFDLYKMLMAGYYWQLEKIVQGFCQAIQEQVDNATV